MSDLIPKHGGYRKLKSFQISQLVYDVTVRFCDLYVDKYSRTRDQMVQAARSGVQNIAEGSVASATSKKTELKLTQVARASLEELKLDYEDFLRQKGFEQLNFDHPALKRFKEKQCKTLKEVQEWVKGEREIAKHGRARTEERNTDRHGQTQTIANENSIKSVPVSDSQCQSVSPCSQSVSPCSSSLVANAALSLLNLACHLLDRQVERLAKDFENDGGFTERLYKVRTEKRRK
ncbi:MAG TPA: four helix bundle suffix domain-containing protein [bacterium]|nr:four helix bundle suffix domain-containing protein [bacterium]HPS31018.1 four helix bundle suffix domain-containing protein [bacterium]